MVPRTGFEPVNAELEIPCRSPLGDRGAIGVNKGSRTLSLCVGNAMLYQLSYVHINGARPRIRTETRASLGHAPLPVGIYGHMVLPAGLEPAHDRRP